jgi:hypothetical protein
MPEIPLPPYSFKRCWTSSFDEITHEMLILLKRQAHLQNNRSAVQYNQYNTNIKQEPIF